MKRIHSFMAAAIAMIAAASCVQELANDAQHNEVAVVYKAVAEGADSKAVLGTNESGRPQSMWEDGDMINIYVGGGLSYRFATSLDEPSPVADFKYAGAGEIDFSDVAAVIAAYPSSISRWADPEWMFPMLESEIRTFQNVEQDVYSYDRNAVPAMAYSTDRTLHFQNAASLLKFKVNQDGVSKVRFTSRNGEYLTGEVTIVLNDDMEVGYINPDEHGAPETLMDFAELSTEGTFHSYRPYYISVIPGTLESGFILEFLDANGEAVFTKEYDRSITLKRNVILDLGTLGEGASAESDDYIDEYGINHGPGVNIDGVVWAPVNCGYHATDFKYGKLYQWGRKYGQGYDGTLYSTEGHKLGTHTDAIVPTFDQGPVSLYEAQSQDNANVSFTVGINSNDWAEIPYDYLWGCGNESVSIKTDCDPCPDGWRVPTLYELCELVKNYSSLTTNESGQSGCWFCGTNTYAEDVPQVFLPSAGFRNPTKGKSNDLGYRGCYWSSDTYNSSASCVIFGYNRGVEEGHSSRAFSRSVRCVKDSGAEFVPVESITANESSLTLMAGQTHTLSVSVAPSNASQPVFWHSSNTSVASVNQKGYVIALAYGNAVISATAGLETVQCELTVTEPIISEYDYIDEYGVNHGSGVKIGEVVWAPVNCGYHETDFKYGKLYQWGRKYGQGYDENDATVPVIEEGEVYDDYADVFYAGTSRNNYDWFYLRDGQRWNLGSEASPVKTEYDPCPDGWRVPAYAELDELRRNHSSWTEEEGQSGYWFSGTSQYTDAVPQVFLPAAGYRRDYGGGAFDRGVFGQYWSSTPSDEYNTYLLHLKNSSAAMFYSYRANGYSVRCVKDDSELIPVIDLTPNKWELALEVSETYTLTATVYPSNSTHQKVYWYSDNTAVATVDQSGNVTAVGEGEVVIWARVGLRGFGCNVTVTAQDVIGKDNDIEDMPEIELF